MAVVTPQPFSLACGMVSTMWGPTVPNTQFKLYILVRQGSLEKSNRILHLITTLITDLSRDIKFQIDL